MPNYLVTGAAGFIGAAVARNLINQGDTVVTVDNLTTGFREAIPDGVQFIEGNCQDSKIIASLQPFKFDAILHIAGQSSGEISYDDPLYDLQTNTQSTLLLLKLASETDCRKFIYASTMSVYGDHPDKPVAEEESTFPESLYGVGKIASEHYMRIYQQYGIETTSLRLFNVYGPGQNMKNLRQGMVSIYLEQALKNKHIIVKGSPDRYRDFVYIDDVVNAFLAALVKPQISHNIYNIATGVRTTVEELIGVIRKKLPFEVPVEYSGSTPGDQFGIYGNCSKSKKELNWHSEVNLDIGIERMVDWVLK